MTRDRQDPTSTVGGADTGPVEDHLLDVEPYPGRGLRRIDLRSAAPFGWTPAVVLGVVALVERADSALVGAVLPKLQEDFGFGDFTAGVLQSAPAVAALLLVGLAGRLADTRNRKNVLAVVIFSWGLFTFGSAAAPTFALFFVARLLLGAAAPLEQPASASIAGDLYPTRGRTKAFAILRVLEYLGLPIGVIVGGLLADAFGWRASFLIMGVPAIILAIGIKLFFKEPRRGIADEVTAEGEARGLLRATVEEPTATVATEAVAPVAAPEVPVTVEGEDPAAEQGVIEALRETLRIPTVRAITIAQSFLFAGASGLFSFATTFFFRVHRDSGLSEGAAAAIAGTIGLIGLIVGGTLASRIGDRYHGVRPGWRVTTAGWTLFVSALTVPVLAFSGNLPVQMACFLILNFGNIIALSNLGAATLDVLPARKRGVGFSALQFMVTIGAATGALIIGAVSSLVVSSRTSIDQAEINAAKDAGEPQSVIDGLEATFWSAQEAGIEWGVGAVSILFILSGVLTFRARRTYEADARAALDETTQA
jgi:MFS family permease